MRRYRLGAHTKSDVKVHLVWIPKYRKAVLVGEVAIRLQLRAVVGEESRHQYLIHDRDKILAKHLDDSIRALGIEVLRSPVASPKANSI